MKEMKNIMHATDVVLIKQTATVGHLRECRCVFRWQTDVTAVCKETNFFALI